MPRFQIKYNFMSSAVYKNQSSPNLYQSLPVLFYHTFLGLNIPLWTFLIEVHLYQENRFGNLKLWKWYLSSLPVGRIFAMCILGESKTKTNEKSATCHMQLWQLNYFRQFIHPGSKLCANSQVFLHFESTIIVKILYVANVWFGVDVPNECRKKVTDKNSQE